MTHYNQILFSYIFRKNMIIVERGSTKSVYLYTKLYTNTHTNSISTEVGRSEQTQIKVQ